jgi:hypothetical protein
MMSALVKSLSVDAAEYWRCVVRMKKRENLTLLLKSMMSALVKSLSVDDAVYGRLIVRTKSVLKGESHLIGGGSSC